MNITSKDNSLHVSFLEATSFKYELPIGQLVFNGAKRGLIRAARKAEGLGVRSRSNAGFSFLLVLHSPCKTEPICCRVAMPIIG